MATMTQLDLIGTLEAAELLGVTRAGINNRVNTGRLTPVGEIGPRGIRLFNRAEIEKLAETQKAGTGNEAA